jgi:hypothetical protein
VLRSALPRDLAPIVPPARGPITEELLDRLSRAPHEIADLPLCTDTDPWTDDDAALALYLCYELHYRGLRGVDPDWEWEPSLLRERRRLEVAFEGAVREAVGPPAGGSPDQVTERLRAFASSSGGPSLSAHMAQRGTLQEMREFAIHRSAYQLKEADPHTWAIPRLIGRSKAALVDIQTGEYGDGRPEALHAQLFADTMDHLGLDPTYGTYVSRLPACTLATCNLVSWLGLHRRWRGALVGHLALFEMSSVGPMGRYVDALRRLGFGDGPAVRFYEAHVEADARHEVVALHDLVGGFLADEPTLGGDVLFGALALVAVEQRMAGHLLTSWQHGQSSLRSD